MSRLEQATERLQSAIDRLDRAMAARPLGEGGGDSELRAALLDAKQENARLQATAAETARGLDSAIARLRAMLEA